ncbi:26S protease regulatory subunit 7 homolog A-like isoform X1 [Arabidopsis lyrata subsp. lyrata]|uniref:26S protease regulatory subunit 7 homolog A-like isoform X1 n=1 Tax=Arabidopsis lyrata subsp. lyrata TaxID=81972 RepID=UPI000A29D428|nr:26S protease regulatory subunit 7 homolog A-like isoform X1 [Arabidopsis lyrata subsp. lyrata]|eukprot:XP_020870410.1 26S protease regulatory subunit 7 homolog A-like isoform X1 [Arabidopsis lyrata subsp. lyrata]
MEHDNEDKKHIPIDEEDIAILKTHALGPYDAAIRKLEKEIKEREKKINDICGVEESDMGLAPRSQWDLVGDEEMMDEEQNLRVSDIFSLRVFQIQRCDGYTRFLIRFSSFRFLHARRYSIQTLKMLDMSFRLKTRGSTLLL